MDEIERNILREAENSVVGSMLLDNMTIPICMETLGDDGQAIMTTQNQLIYAAVVALYSEGKPCDELTVAEKLETSGELNRVGGIEYISDIVDKVPTVENVGYYATLIADAFIKRKLIACGPKLKLIAESDISVEAMQGKAQEVVLNATSDIAKESLTIKEQADQAHQRLKVMSEGQHIQLSTGFPNFDLMINGLQKSKYYLIAGLASIGKSALVQNMLYHIAVELQRPAVLFCYESDAASVILRMVSMQTGINLMEDARMAINNPEILQVFNKIQKSPLIILDDIPFSVEYAVARTQRIKVEHPDLAVAVYDHIHDMTADVGSNSTQEHIVSTISKNLKRLAKILRMPVVALSQMSRASIRQQNPRPMLNDLRSSGALEFGADVVAFLYRDDYYEPTTPSPISETELIIRKSRDGPVGTLKYKYYRATSKFEEA